MSTTAAATAQDLFRQALEQFESAMRTGAKVQEDTINLLLSMLRDPNMPRSWVERIQEVLRSAVPAAQRNLEEAMRLMNENTQASLDLLQQACEAAQSTSLGDAQTRTRDMWETSLRAMRSNMQAITQANTRAIASWEKFLGDLAGGNGGTTT